MPEKRLPHLQHAFSMSAAGASLRESPFPTGPTASAAQKESNATAYGTRNLLEAKPSDSQLVIHARPSRPWEMLEVETFGVLEDLLHGERQQFGFSRSIHLLKQQNRAHLFAIIRGDHELSFEQIAEEIVEGEIVCNRVTELEDPFLESVDQFLTHIVAEEAGYLEDHAHIYADIYDVGVDGVLSWLEAVREEHKTKRIPNRAVYNTLLELETDYSLSVAESVAYVALDFPAPLAPLEISGYDAIAVDELSRDDLIVRFEKTVAALAEVSGDPIAMAPDELRRELHTQLQHPETSTEEPHTLGPEHLPLPLLDHPSQEPHDEDVQQVDSELDRIILRAFGSVGSFGGLVFWLDDENGIPNWLVNPRVERDRMPDGRLYKHHWEEAYFGNRALAQLIDQMDPEKDRRQVECPFCRISRTPRCGGDKCTYQPYVTRIRELQGEFIDCLRMSDTEHNLISFM